MISLAAVWRSPSDQPSWARPALLVVAALAGLGYAWGANSALLEPFYGAAARSMSVSWHDFIFGAFDPLGTVTVDKLPGALWLQALSLRIFGFHIWAVVLPQILEGIASVLVLYRAVRRLAGPVAGIAAAVTLAAIPVTVEVNRGNVSDALLILLTVLAADATTAAIVTGRWRKLLFAGLWVGLGFQAKMLQAWLVLPALTLAYLVCAPGPRLARVRQVALAGLVTVLVSLSWISAVSLVPSSQRPYVDGSRNDSLFSQVFVYNGYARLGRSESRSSIAEPPAFMADLAAAGEALNAHTFHLGASPDRLLGAPLGRDAGWLLPAAILAGALLFWERRRAGRTDPRLAGLLLWSTWLLTLGISFSGGLYVNSYYLSALSPAIAALSGLGAELYWRRRTEPRARAALAVALAATAGYGTFLLAGGVRVPSWVLPVCLAITAVGCLAVLLGSLRAGRRHAALLGALALVCLLPFSAIASALVVADGLGPFDIPYDGSPPNLAASVSVLGARLRADVDRLEARVNTPIAMATYTSMLASELIFYSGKEILPIGGYLGTAPSPTVRELKHYVSTDTVRFFDAPVVPAVHDPRIVWVERYCRRRATTPLMHGVQTAIFDCSSAQ